MKIIRKFIAVPALLYCFLMALASWLFWIDMFFFADQAQIDNYYFGVQSGFAFLSYQHYLWSCFGSAVYTSILIYGFWREFRERPVVPFWVLALGFGAFLWVHLYIM